MTTHVYPWYVHIDDTDYGGVVYHANYLKYMERARWAWITALGYGLEWQRENHIGFVVKEAAIDYLRSAPLDASLEIHSSITDIKGASISFEQRVVSANDHQQTFAMAEIVIVCVGEAMRRPRRLPKEIVEGLNGQCTARSGIL